VDPPKIGLGVFGLSLGAVHGAGAAAAAAFSSARTTRAAPREEDARRVVARGVTMRTREEVAERLNMDGRWMLRDMPIGRPRVRDGKRFGWIVRVSEKLQVYV
jgi:hypothetical protein